MRRYFGSAFLWGMVEETLLSYPEKLQFSSLPTELC